MISCYLLIFVLLPNLIWWCIFMSQIFFSKRLLCCLQDQGHSEGSYNQLNLVWCMLLFKYLYSFFLFLFFYWVIQPILSKCCWQLLSILKPSYQTFSDINFHYKFGTLFRRCTAFVCVCVFGVGGSFLMRTKFWKCVTVLTKHTHTQRHCQTTSMWAGFCCSYCCCCHCSCFSLMF